MRRLIFISLVLVVLLSLIPFAQAATYSGTCGESLTWSYNASTKTLTISGNGELINTGEIWYDYKDEIQTITLNNGITYISKTILEDHRALTTINLPNTLITYANGAFDGNPNLKKFTVKSGSAYFSADSAGLLYDANKTKLYICPPAKSGSISLPTSVTEIFDNAFADCSAITSVSLPSSLQTIGDNAFSNCSGITSFSLPASLQTIGNSAFAGCTAITTLHFGASLKSIGNDVFPDSANFKSITVNSNNTYFSAQDGILYNKAKSWIIRCPGGYSGSYTMPDTVTTMRDRAFFNCDGLTSVSLSNNLEIVPESAFSDCDALTAVTFGEKITKIAVGAFRSCELLTCVTLPENLTAIESGAFRDCTGLAQISIGSKLNSLGNSAFSGCTALKQIALPETVTTLPKMAFYGCSALQTVTFGSSLTSIGESCFEGCSALTGFTFPASLKIISTRAFYNCDAITEIKLPNTLTSLGTYAFYDCDGLISLTIGNGLTSLPESVFASCYRLREVDFGSSLTSLGYQAFSGSGLIYVRLPEQLTGISRYAFYSCSKLEAIYIPSAVTNIYNSAFYYSTPCHVFYGGSEADFAKVTVAANNNRLTEAVWHYNATPSALSKNFTCQYSHYRCTLCGDMFGYDILADGGHTFANGICTVCEVPECVDYFLNTYNGEVKINGMHEDIAVPEILKIPDTIEACPVISIADNAFRSQEFSAVVLPKTLQTIGNWAFYDCKSLYSIDFGDSLISVGEGAFSACKNLRAIRLPDSVQTIAYSAFSSCDYLYQAELGSSLQTIGKYAFSSCPRLVGVHLGGDLKTVDYNAFYSCDLLTHVTHRGTSEAWNAITFGDGNNSLRNASRHDNCMSATISFTTICTGSLAHCSLCAKPIRFMDEGGTVHWFENGVCLVCGVPEYLNYTIGTTSCTVTINGYDGSVSEIVIPDTIEGLPVTVIAAHAFANDSNLQKITIGNNVTEIQSSSFQNCTNLTDVTLGENVRTIASSAFRDCDALSSITLPDSVVNLYSAAFYDCDSLTAVLGGSGVETYGSSVFYDCDALTDIEALTSVKNLGQYSFYHCDSLAQITLPDTLRFIGTYCFSDCDKLTEITFGEGLETLETCAFYDCDGLLSVTLPKSLSVLEQYTFSSCDALTYADIGGVKTVNQYVFENCTSLKELHLESAVDILWYAFTGCTALDKVYFGDQLQRCDAYSFENCSALTEMHITDIAAWCSVKYGMRSDWTLRNSELYLNGEPIVDLVIPEGVTYIGQSAFEYCSTIKTVTLPMSLESIGAQAFSYCTSLESVYIPEYVTQMGTSVFNDCTSLTSVRGMIGLTSIPGGTFGDCTSLVSIHLPYAIETIGEYAFGNCSSLVYIYLPDDLTTIKERAFEDCNRLNHILYESIQKYWNNITIKSGSPVLTIATVHYKCSGGEITWKELLGERYPYCTVCEMALTEKPKCFHDEMRLYDEKSPTCTEYGYTGDVWCLICGDCVERGQKIEPLGHNLEEVIVEATCQTQGYVLQECSRCDYSYQSEVLPLLPHQDVAYVTPPTCDTEGYTAYCCSVCGESYFTDFVPPLGHNFVPSPTATVPDCLSGGLVEHICTNCGEYSFEYINPKQHTYTVTVVEPTCTDGGYTDYLCEHCGDSYRADYVPAEGHHYEGGSCTVCGEIDPDYVAPEFTDVPENEWYRDAVDFAVENGLMNGMSATTFEPNTTMNRAMLVTVLWRYASSPIEGENIFTDVPNGQWYTEAVAWAAHNGIVGGIGNNRFAPNGNITREQLATILYRYCNSIGIDTSNEALLSSYPDCDKISSYAIRPLAWAVGAGLINGIEVNGKVHLQPQGNATRAQVATILMRFIENVIN